jgi:hypothetical protein
LQWPSLLRRKSGNLCQIVRDGGAAFESSRGSFVDADMNDTVH